MDADLALQISDFQKAVQNAATSKVALTTLDSKILAKYIDHTLLKLDATTEQIDELCKEARAWEFKTVCIRLNFVSRAIQNLQGSPVLVCCVVGFPEGTQSLETKLTEAAEAVRLGATELDTVINVPQLHAQSYSTILAELQAFRQRFPAPTTTLKLILETSQLSEPEILAGCKLASLAGFDFVKTSTGFLGHGAKVEHVALMRKAADVEGNGMRVKASGGVRTFDDAMAMVEAGADRLGVSAGVAIVRGAREREQSQ